MPKPTVAIVGRPNVGKSTIFNRIVGERISIVEDIAGVTRDRIYSSGEWLNHDFNIIDTGGIDIGDEPFIEQIRSQAEIAIDEADVIISKGQGNFETLQECGLNIYYLFLCKCTMFANRFGVPRFTGMLLNDNRM